MNIGLVHDGYERGIAQFRVWHDAISPLTLGLENVPPPGALAGRPLLFIGNHTQFGLYDLPLLFMEMYSKGAACRPCAGGCVARLLLRRLAHRCPCLQVMFELVSISAMCTRISSSKTFAIGCVQHVPACRIPADSTCPPTALEYATRSFLRVFRSLEGVAHVRVPRAEQGQKRAAVPGRRPRGVQAAWRGVQPAVEGRGRLCAAPPRCPHVTQACVNKSSACSADVK